jgi:hypothetical protein
MTTGRLGAGPHPGHIGGLGLTGHNRLLHDRLRTHGFIL